MKAILRLTSALAVIVVLLAEAGCLTESNEINKNANPTANTNAKSTEPATPAPAAATTVTAPTNLQPVTLPVLDAFFAQENFAGELKSKLQLSDEQIDRLRTIARQETAKLRESSDDVQSDGKATAAREHAFAETKATIGEEKTRQLIAFVNERWSGDVNAGTPPGAPPNSGCRAKRSWPSATTTTTSKCWSSQGCRSSWPIPWRG